MLSMFSFAYNLLLIGEKKDVYAFNLTEKQLLNAFLELFLCQLNFNVRKTEFAVIVLEKAILNLNGSELHTRVDWVITRK